MTVGVSITSNPISVAIQSDTIAISFANSGPQGVTGPQGAIGPAGPTGPSGIGLPPGGTTGQVATKASNNDYDVEWSSAGGSGNVTSVGLSMPSGFSVASSPITGSGTLAVTTALSGILKGTGTGFSAATAGTDYSPGTASLGTGILKSTTTTGTLSIAVASDFPTLNQNTTGSSATCTGNAGTVTSINGKIAAGTNVTVTGSGTSGSPYSINAAGGTPGGSSTQIQFNNSGHSEAFRGARPTARICS